MKGYRVQKAVLNNHTNVNKMQLFGYLIKIEVLILFSSVRSPIQDYEAR